MSGKTVLVLGADGFIGRHIAFGLRQSGWTVLACARRTSRLARMGFDVLQADLADPETHDPGFWAGHLEGVDAVINAAGLLNGSDRAFRAVHLEAPRALYAAMPDGCRGVLISAVGIDAAQTAFARFRREGETLATAQGLVALRPGLVLGDTSYGGSSLLRALAACPLVTPVVGDGSQPFNPIHAADLAATIAAILDAPPAPGVYAIGGPETVTQLEMTRAYRGWLGLSRAKPLCLPLPVARAVGTVGDLLRLGPISRTSVAQLAAGVEAETDPRLPASARGFSEFVAHRPAGTQDLWHARLYLLRPVLRLALAVLWIVSGIIGLLLPPDQFLPLVAGSGVPDTVLVALARMGGGADLMIAYGILRAVNARWMAALQGLLIAGYTLVFSALAPGLWVLPLGGLLKNIPLLVLVAFYAVLEDER